MQIKFISVGDFDGKRQLDFARCDNDETPTYYMLWLDAMKKVQATMDLSWARDSNKFVNSLTLHFNNLVAALWKHAEATPEFNDIVALALPPWPEDVEPPMISSSDNVQTPPPKPGAPKKFKISRSADKRRSSPAASVNEASAQHVVVAGNNGTLNSSSSSSSSSTVGNPPQRLVWPDPRSASSSSSLTTSDGDDTRLMKAVKWSTNNQLHPRLCRTCSQVSLLLLPLTCQD